MIQFKQYLLNKQAEWGRILSASDIAEESGVSRDTINRLLKDNPPKRIDEGTVKGLCKFFGVKPGEPIPFLVYDPDN